MATNEKKSATKTKKVKKPLTKVVVKNTDVGDWVKPKTGEIFYINEKIEFPDVVFEVKSDSKALKKWEWEISWDAAKSGLSEKKRGGVLQNFKEKGSFEQTEGVWNIKDINKIIGGTVVVKVDIEGVLYKRTVKILGKNPLEDDVKNYLEIKDASALNKIIKQESRYKNFINLDSEPVVSFDKGYGITQLTNPAPKYHQIWSWKENIDAALVLMNAKKKEALNYFKSKKESSYTDEMLDLEILARWNGGAYHKWDAEQKQWIRNPNILCDSEQGNTGWDISREENKNKTEEELRKRDIGKKQKRGGDQWFYTGVCYADHVAN